VLKTFLMLLIAVLSKQGLSLAYCLSVRSTNTRLIGKSDECAVTTQPDFECPDFWSSSPPSSP